MERPGPSISVVVAVRNGEQDVAGLLDALAAQTIADHTPSGTEIIVVDDASTDGTAAAVEAHGAAQLVRLRRRVGSYAARNVGVELARGEVIAITDADCRPLPGWLEETIAALEAGADLVGGRIEVPLPSRPAITMLLDAGRYLDQRRFVADGFAAFANFGCRSALIGRVGPFDSRLRSNGDREFCRRAVAAGFRLAYADRAVVLHPPLARPREVAKRSARLGRGRARAAAASDRGRSGDWMPLPAYLPSALFGARHWATERLRECGHEPSFGEKLRMDLAAYGLIGLPTLVGYAFGHGEAWLEARARS